MTARISRLAAGLVPLVALLALPLLSSSSRAPSPTAAADRYIGAAKCKNCHSAEDQGDAYGTWSEAKHAHAFEVLKTPAAKEAGAKLGIDDPSTSDTCLECHVTGHGEDEGMLARGFKAELGVQCETCHGPGEAHMKARFKAAASGEAPEGYQGIATEEMVVSPGVELCVGCHNPRSPSYKPFCYYEARGVIAHLDPRKPRTDEEKAAIGTCPHGSPCPHAEGCPDGTCNLKPDELAGMRK